MFSIIIFIIFFIIMLYGFICRTKQLCQKMQWKSFKTGCNQSPCATVKHRPKLSLQWCVLGTVPRVGVYLWLRAAAG